MAATEHSTARTEPAGWDDAAKAMFRAAQAVAQAGGPKLFADLVRELADTLRVATVFVAVFGDETRRQMRTLAAVLDGRTLQNFDYALEGTPCAKVVGRAFRHVPRGVAAEFPPGTIFAAKGMDSYAAFPLSDSDGTPLGLLVAMDRQPIADAALAEALLKIFAGRMVAEIERSHVDEALRAAALAVSSTRGDSVFVELVRLLAAILRVEVAFISRYEQRRAADAAHAGDAVPASRSLQDVRYPIRGTPCETVLGQRFRVYPDRLRELFPEDADAQAAGHRQLRRVPAGRPGRHAAGHRRPSPRARRCCTWSASSRCCRSSRCAPPPRSSSCAPPRRCALGGQLPRHLRSRRGRDLHPRLGQRRDPRRQPQGLRDLRLHARRDRRLSVADLSCRRDAVSPPSEALQQHRSWPGSTAARPSNGSAATRTAACTGTRCG